MMILPITNSKLKIVIELNFFLVKTDNFVNRNPTKGIIINRPNGPDVYKGVLKDYTGKEVTPKNFLNVLQGNAAAMKGIGSGKVINRYF